MNVLTTRLTTTDFLIQQPRVRPPTTFLPSHDARRIRYSHHWAICRNDRPLFPKMVIVLPVLT